MYADVVRPADRDPDDPGGRQSPGASAALPALAVSRLRFTAMLDRPLQLPAYPGANAANLIPLEQLDAREVWVLQTPEMRTRAAHLQTALARDGRIVTRVDFDDSSPEAITRSAQAITVRLDGRHVILHATGERS